MGDYYILDENKNAIPCSVDDWIEQREQMRKTKTKHVADEMIGHFRISTVWVGLNHNLGKNGEPLLFETMVFDQNGDDIYCAHYWTWQQAEEGHKKAIQWVKDGCRKDE